MNWKSISSLEQIEKIIRESHEIPVVIFKHSTTCPISSMAKMRIEDKWAKVAKPTSFYYLDLLTFRNISHAIAEKFAVHHESPQLILLKDGEAEYDASHFDITIDELNESLSYHYG